MGKTYRKEVRVRVAGQRRKEPDVRRLAKAIIRMSLDNDEATEQMLELEHQERVRARRPDVADEPPEKARS